MSATLILIAIVAYFLVTSFVLLMFRGMRDRDINEAKHYIKKKQSSHHLYLDKAS